MYPSGVRVRVLTCKRGCKHAHVQIRCISSLFPCAVCLSCPCLCVFCGWVWVPTRVAQRYANISCFQNVDEAPDPPFRPWSPLASCPHIRSLFCSLSLFPPLPSCGHAERQHQMRGIQRVWGYTCKVHLPPVLLLPSRNSRGGQRAEGGGRRAEGYLQWSHRPLRTIRATDSRTRPRATLREIYT